MSDSFASGKERAEAYARSCGITLGPQLGFGNDRTIWTTSRATAVKVFDRIPAYHRERDVYLRLRERGIINLREFAVPKLVDFDDELAIVEMGIVPPPFVLDFAKAYLDEAPEFSPEVMADWEAARVEMFGADWRKIQRALRALSVLGIYYFDATPGNIRLRAEDGEME